MPSIASKACLLTLLLPAVTALTCNGEDEDACPVAGSAALQARSVSGHKDAKEADDAVELHGVSFTDSPDAIVDSQGRKTWIISAESCDDAAIEAMAKDMPEGTEVEFKGHPDEGGLCIFMMKGTKEQVMEELKNHKLADKVDVQVDVPISVVPEVEDEEGDGAELAQTSWPLATGLSKDNSAAVPWGLDRIDGASDGSYNPPQSGKGGAGVHVYVYDTGIRTTHEEFEGRAVPTLEVMPWEKECDATDTSCANDGGGHGTHVAGTVGGKTYGVAPKCTLHAIRVLNDRGHGSITFGMKAFEWMFRNAVRPAVAVLSLGGKATIPSYASMGTTVKKAVEKGFTVVIAAGNDRRDDACTHQPAAEPSAITVAGTDKYDKVGWYSNLGTCVDIFAPGSRITSASHRDDTRSAVKTGTSMAAPHVAGAAALLLAEDSSLSPAGVASALLWRCEDGKVSGNTVCVTGGATPNKLLSLRPGQGPAPDLQTQAPMPTPPPTPPTPVWTPMPSTSPPPTPAPSTPAPSVPSPSTASGGGGSTCGFEQEAQDGKFCSTWSQSTEDDFDWTRRSWGTPTSGTGPNMAAEGTYYVYCEMSAKSRGVTAVLQTDPMDLKGKKLKFKFNAHIWDGELAVLVGKKEAFKHHKNMWSKWQDAEVDLDKYAAEGPQVVSFRCTRGYNFRGDLAIDAVTIA